MQSFATYLIGQGIAGVERNEYRQGSALEQLLMRLAITTAITFPHLFSSALVFCTGWKSSEGGETSANPTG
jgi:hypothetical protein